MLFYDRAFQPLVDKLKSQWKTIEHYVVFDLAAGADGDEAFETLIVHE